MPAQPAWFHRLDEIFTALRARSNSFRLPKSSVGRSAVQPAQSTSVSGWTSPGAYRRRSCAGFSAKRRGIRGSAGVYFHRARAKMEILV